MGRMYRNIKKTFTDKIDEAIVKFPPEKFDYTFVSFDAIENVLNYIYGYATNKIGENVINGILPINVCAHCGPGTIGIVVSEKINGKALSDFIK